jgi:hypothetical protein
MSSAGGKIVERKDRLISTSITAVGPHGRSVGFLLFKQEDARRDLMNAIDKFHLR